MKIINLSYQAHPQQTDPDKWISNYGFFYDIWEAVAQQHEVIFIEFIGATASIQRNGITYYFQQQSKAALLFPFWLHRFIRAQQPDVVVVHGLLFPLQILLLRKALGNAVTIIAQHHAEQPFRYLRRYLQPFADRKINHYLFTGNGLAAPWIQKGMVDARKVVEVMETTSIFYVTNKAAARKVTGVFGEKVYLWVGRLNANKDPLLLVAAFLEHAKTHPQAQLYMIYQEESLLPQIKLLLQQYPQAAAQIHLIGKVPHATLQDWYNSADFIVSCSHYEGSGVAVTEAMSCGCIPLITDIPSFRYMTGGSCGILFAPGNAAALTAALNTSATMDIHNNRRQTLEQYNSRLSAPAIAAQICGLIER